ncbi:MAG TPA: DinB family protein [Candidatus Limnocylindria bacterium]|nr:DinB family protein [Candidatus Limnocylindria bacterium]
MDDAWAACLARLEERAPDVIACWRVFDWSRSGLVRLRRELRPRVATGDAPRILAQQEAVADELAAVLDALPEAALRAPGGEEDWNVAQAFAHTTAARRFLVAWAAQDVGGAWAGDEPRVTPSVPGPADATREQLRALLDKSRASMARSAATIEGHEVERCRMAHPLVGHLRHGEWLAFVGIHDLMHLEQLHRLAASHA